MSTLWAGTRAHGPLSARKRFNESVPDGPEVAPAAVDRLEDKLAGYHTYHHATRADLLRRLGCSQKSRAAYDKAIEAAGNTGEIGYLIRRRDQPG